MKDLLKKGITYYRYNGFIRTLKTIIRKLFPFKIFRFDNLKKYRNYKLELKEAEKGNVVLKSNKKVFIFATIPYYDVGGGQRSSQLSKIFNRMGHEVIYIYAYDSSETNIRMMEMPLSIHKHIDKIDILEIENMAKEDDIFIFEAPIKSFYKYVELAKENKAKVIYENIDNWETSLGSMFFDEETLKFMLDKSDMIVATAELLVKQVEQYFIKYNITVKPVYYLANAVDDELFEYRKSYEVPKDFKKGTKTLLYYGSLWGEWFDWDIITNIAKSNDKISINLIGDYSPIKDKIKSLPENIHFWGLKKQVELPAYLKNSDYAILPFKPGNISDYVSPLKIFEYISMNSKILATDLVDIKGYPNVFASNDYKEWINTIKNDTINIDIQKRDEFINNNNWYNRCCKMLDILFPIEAKKVEDEFYSNVSVVILNYNNMKVITKCVDTLLLNNSRYNYEIIVVDNNSKDGSYEHLLENYSEKIKIVRNVKNGCSSGRNLGVENATKEYILFLDSDEWILHRYWLDNYLKIMKEDKKVGAVGWGAGWFNAKRYAYKVVDAYEHRYMPPIGLYRKDIGYLATCGFIIRKDIFNKIEGFDLYYDPTGYEDTDLSLKVRNYGLDVVYSPYLGVGHLPHQTTRSGTDAHSKLLQEKGTYFINKWVNIDSSLIDNYKK